jgi:hypothetical protein
MVFTPHPPDGIFCRPAAKEPGRRPAKDVPMRKLALLFALAFPLMSLGQTASGWPGSVIGQDLLQSGNLDFRGAVFSFKHPSNGHAYVAFEANVAGTSTQYKDGVAETFLIDTDDKASVAAVYTAAAAGIPFTVQYRKDPDFMGRPVLVAAAFLLRP